MSSEPTQVAAPKTKADYLLMAEDYCCLADAESRQEYPKWMRVRHYTEMSRACSALAAALPDDPEPWATQLSGLLTEQVDMREMSEALAQQTEKTLSAMGALRSIRDDVISLAEAREIARIAHDIAERSPSR